MARQKSRSVRQEQGVLAWALYDWANSPFTTLIITFVFPAYFAGAVIGNETIGQAWWGYGIAISGLFISILSPIFGAIADAGGKRKPWLFAFSLLCIIASGLLWLIKPDRAHALLALVLVAVANIGFEFGTVFNNAMLPDLVAEERMGRWSGWAWALGYLGGLAALLLALIGPLQHPTWLGLDRSQAEQVRILGPFVGLWFAVFTWPIFVWTPDRKRTGLSAEAATKRGLIAVARTLRGLANRRNVVLFLVAHMLYSDALVGIFAFGGIYAAGVFGMGLRDVTLFGIVLNITAGLGAFCFAWVDDRIGSRRTILVALAGLLVTSIMTIVAQERLWFWIGGSLLGLFVGPAQAASRTLMARLAPKGEEAEFFGLFAFSGKATAFLGPAMVAVVTAISGNQRAGLASLLVLLLAGAAGLVPVVEPNPWRSASQLHPK